MNIGGASDRIRADRVVAVVACLHRGLIQIGSGYLVTERLVLTARPCTTDERTGRLARSLRVIRRSDGAEALAEPSAGALDVAVLAIGAGSAWAEAAVLEPPQFGRVDDSCSGELGDCAAAGFPLWQLDSLDQQRKTAELRGTIQVTEDGESRLLVMRDPLLADVGIPGTVADEDRAPGSLWGGLSGALVFCQGIALGVITEHRPRQDRSAITIVPVERFAAVPAGGDPDAVAVAKLLGLPPADRLPVTRGQPLAGLVDVLAQGRLPRVSELAPYTLGATPSGYGNADTYRQRDEYVPRTKDEPLAAALRPGRLVVLAGPSKSGKSRTAFEVLRAHKDWSAALLAVPAPRLLNQLAGHPALSSADPLVIWLDELQRFLPPTGDLSEATISHLLERPGPAMLLATIRTEQPDLLRGTESELTREARMVLDSAASITLDSTRRDPGEQARAATVYPEADSRPEGLAEILAGAPELLRRYRDAAAADPLLHTLVQTCVDWARCGLARPIPEPDLLVLAQAALKENRPDLILRDNEIDEALGRARTPAAGEGQVALLRADRPVSGCRGYEAFDYLVAADDGQGSEPARPVSEITWRRVLDCATNEEALGVGVAAFVRGSIPVAVAASRRAAEAGHADAQYSLGVMLTTGLDPPDLAGARIWWTKAAEAGRTDAQYALGVLLATRLSAPDVTGARIWWTKAAEAGHTDAQYNLGMLLAYELDPPDLAAARAWWTKAAEAGDASAQYALGALLADGLDPPDLAAARTWWTKAAQAGHSGAQYGLGVLLADGLDPPDLAAARAWWTKAAEAGDASAQYGLGVLLATGLDPPDLAAACAWWTKAAEAGHSGAQYGLGVLLATGLDPPDLAAACAWWTKAAQAGHSSAQYRLGRLLADRLDPPDLAAARTWWTRAAEAGHTDAQYNLGRLLATRIDPPDLPAARTWWTRAAEAGHTDAQYNLGVLLADLLDPPDLAAARIWWTRAAEAGDAEAQYSLGALLATRLDPPELAEARIWWTRAAKQGAAAHAM